MAAFEERLSNPTNYYIFYDYFLRAAVGDKAWKQVAGVMQSERHKKARLSGASDDSNESLSGSQKRMSSSLDEAFALIMLKNNYFAWLLEYKEKSSGKVLLTDYDQCVFANPSLPYATVAQHVLEGSIIDLQKDESESGEKDQTYVIWKPKDGDTNEVKAKYLNAVMDYDTSCATVRLQVATSKDYADVSESLQELKTVKDVLHKKSKKRKLMKGLKTYTGKCDEDEKPHRGWNSKTFQELLALKGGINRDKKLYKKFGKAYRKVYEVTRGGTLRDRRPSIHGLLTDEQHQKLFEEDVEDRQR